MALNRMTSQGTLIALVLIASCQLRLGADSWALPTVFNHDSNNGGFRIQVQPRVLARQLEYFSEELGSKAGSPRSEHHAWATVSRRHWYGFRREARFQLVNDVAPVKALISNDGAYVVTIENWHMVGQGPNVVVIYKGDGSLVGKLALTDIFTSRDINTFPESTSSIWWGDGHYIDDAHQELVLRALSNGDVRPSLSPTYGEVRIELATAKLKEPKRDRYWHTRFVPEIVPQLRPDSAEDILPLSLDRPLPPYPPLARVARIQGTVELEVVVDYQGNTVHARARSGPVQLHRHAEGMLRLWRFKQASDRPKMLRTGVITLHYGRIETRT